jgi:hypothetical protein
MGGIEGGVSTSDDSERVIPSMIAGVSFLDFLETPREEVTKCGAADFGSATVR